MNDEVNAAPDSSWASYEKFMRTQAYTRLKRARQDRELILKFYYKGFVDAKRKFERARKDLAAADVKIRVLEKLAGFK